MYQKLRQTIFAFAFIVVVASNSHHQIVDAQQINSEAGMASDVDERVMHDIIIEMMKDDQARRAFEDEQPASFNYDSEEQLVEQQQQQPAELNEEQQSQSVGEKENAVADVPPAAAVAPPIPEKKGESEFVTFVDPGLSARRLDRQIVKQQQVLPIEEKRVPATYEAATKSGVFGSFTNVSNMLFLAVVTVCVVAAVIGAAAMGVYWHGLQKERSQAAKEAEYPQYGVIGPSKEKKSRRQNGDEKMAYKAQLHHYQQTKQKIISGEEGAGAQGGVARQPNEESGESDVEDEANYSVYECPGLAPTGNIEVQNPNFDHGGHN